MNFISLQAMREDEGRRSASHQYFDPLGRNVVYSMTCFHMGGLWIVDVVSGPSLRGMAVPENRSQAIALCVNMSRMAAHISSDRARLILFSSYKSPLC
jgi:hypothetical protein